MTNRNIELTCIRLQIEEDEDLSENKLEEANYENSEEETEEGIS